MNFSRGNVVDFIAPENFFASTHRMMDILTLMDSKRGHKIDTTISGDDDVNCNNILMRNSSPSPAPRVPPINLDDFPKFLLGKSERTLINVVCARIDSQFINIFQTTVGFYDAQIHHQQQLSINHNNHLLLSLHFQHQFQNAVDVMNLY